MTVRVPLIVLASCVALAACETDEDPAPRGSVMIHFEEVVDGTPIVEHVDGTAPEYTNAAGNEYGITNVEYLVSDFTLIGDDDHSHKHDSSHALSHYRNAFNSSTGALMLEDVPSGDYHSLSFWWGVPPTKNFGSAAPGSTDPRGLPAQFDDMLWPAGEAGGYHCMRFEGQYAKSGLDDGTYQLHMGRLVTDSGATVTDGHFLVTLDGLHLSVVAGETLHLSIRMDMNAWMDDPVLDFTATAGGMPLDGPTMPNHAAQALMRDNGDDVFSLMEHAHTP